MIYLLLTWLAAPFLLLRAAWRGRQKRGRILVVQTAKIGDFVATTPVFRALRSARPDWRIVALLDPALLPLAANLDSIDATLSLPPGGLKGWAGKRWLLRELASGYDAVLVLSPNLAHLLLPLWAGVACRVAVLGDRRQGSSRLAWPLLTHGEPHRAGQLFRDTALKSLQGLGITVDTALRNLPPEAPGRASPAVAARLAALHAAPRPYLGLGLGAGNRMKALDAAQWHELVRQLAARTPATLVLTGVAVDRELAADLAARLPAGRVIDTVGDWPLAEFPCLLAEMDAFVGVDSGATYLADAQGVPVVDFMGPADAADQRPGGPRAVVIKSGEPCAPCSHAFDAPYACRLGTRACIATLPIERLVAAVVGLLAAPEQGSST